MDRCFIRHLDQFLRLYATCIIVKKLTSYRLNGSSSPVLTATYLSYGEAKNLTHAE